jgi:hypothetical protein
MNRFVKYALIACGISAPALAQTTINGKNLSLLSSGPVRKAHQ